MPKKVVSEQDITAQLITGLRTAAVRPNVLGYKPHAKQQIFHEKQIKGRLYIGGNRSGKTTAGVVEGIWRLTGKHPYGKPPLIATPERPIRGRVVGVDFPNGIKKILLPEYQRWLPPSELKGGSWYSAWQESLKILNLANGSTVEFMSYDQDLDKFAGTSREFVHYDEEVPKEIFNECNARLIDTGGYWWMTMTPVEGMTWIYDDIYEPAVQGMNDKVFVVEAAMEENPHIDKAEIKSFLDGLDKDEREARGKGKFVQMGGLVFKTFNPEVHVIYPDSPNYIALGDLLRPERKIYNSLDHGYSNPTAVLWHSVGADDVAVTFGEHYKAEWTVEQHATVIKQMNKEYGRNPDMYVCDPALAQKNGATGTSIQFEYNVRGLPYMLGNNDVTLGIDKINEYLRYTDEMKPHWFIYGANCPNLVREMARLRWSKYVSKKIGADRNAQETIHKKNDHAPDSARYFFTQLPDLKPIPKREKAEADWRQQFGNVPTALPIYAPRIDKKLAAGPKKKTEWTVIDEHMGGIF